MINWTQRHKDKAIRERRPWLIKHCSIEQAKAAARIRDTPFGSIWLWTIGVVGPENTATDEELREYEA